MTTLVIRPAPQGKELCALILKYGIASIHLPVINIQSVSIVMDLPKQLKKSNLIIAVSQYAVSFCNQHLNGLQQYWPRSPRYLAIGKKTAGVLSTLSQQQVYSPPRENSESLLSHPLLDKVKGAKITILRGRGGRQLLARQLVLRGAQVSCCEFYERAFVYFDVGREVQRWKKMEVDSVIVTSEEQLHFFCRRFTESQLKWVTKHLLLVPSERIAITARKLFGFEKTIVVGSANNNDLATMIRMEKNKSA